MTNTRSPSSCQENRHILSTQQYPFLRTPAVWVNKLRIARALLLHLAFLCLCSSSSTREVGILGNSPHHTQGERQLNNALHPAAADHSFSVTIKVDFDLHPEPKYSSDLICLAELHSFKQRPTVSLLPRRGKRVIPGQGFGE